MRVIGIALILVSFMFISGCAATGNNFSGVELPSKDNGVIYFLRRSNFVGSAYCPPIEINGSDIGCLKNGGFIRYEVSSGTYEIKIRKRFLEVGDEITEVLELSDGDVIFIEWHIYHKNFYESFIEHTQKDAIVILESLKESS